ncbi:hypothetical protein ACRYCC_25980 [Actinomadura scrupuli]|uniref:hypothetical protein n=1 Tax=Actinomadura scrupuli TaxID=559629 RepID=UPI003D95F95C
MTTAQTDTVAGLAQHLIEATPDREPRVIADVLAGGAGLVAGEAPELAALLTATAEQVLAEEIRSSLESLVVLHQNGEVDDGWVMLHLVDWRPDLPSWDRWALWQDLSAAHQRWQDAENPDVDINWDLVEPELRDPQLYADKMRGEVDELIEQLVSGGGR